MRVNPWYIAGAIVIGGVVLFASQVASAAPECEIGVEAVTPYLGVTAILLRECRTEGETHWLWDVAMIEDVVIGEGATPEEWPEESLGFGQADDQDMAMSEAMAWVDEHVDWLLEGGPRGPLAQRTEDFLAELAPTQLADLRELFAFDEPIGDGWPAVERLRTATSDEEYREIAADLGDRLQQLTDDELAAFKDDVLEAIGMLHGLTLRSILTDAGVM